MKNMEILEKIKESRVAVLGMGVSNVPLVAFLLELGVKDITVYDKKEVSELHPKAREYEAAGVKFVSGNSYLENVSGDYIFRSPGIRDDYPSIAEAVSGGAVLTSEMELFFELTPARIIAITGSDGKTTTTTLTYKILKEELEKKGSGKVYVGGNIGQPLLSLAKEMTSFDYAVVELSSFQLKTMKKAPYRAAITNISPNHLDWHTDMQEYIDCKFNICGQGELDRLVTNRESEDAFELSKKLSCGVTLISSKRHNFIDISDEGHGKKAVFERDGEVILSDGTLNRVMLKSRDIKLVGRHNLENYMTAIALLDGLVSYDSIRKVATSFGGVEHRMEFVREHRGVKYYNSSIDSTPTRTEAALSAFEQKPIVIMGGYDKHIPFDRLGDIIHQKAKAVVLTGATREAINAAIKNSCYASDSGLKTVIKPDFKDAVMTAADMAQDGDVVVLSPACASFDAFKNFEERGNIFKDIINSMEKENI